MSNLSSVNVQTLLQHDFITFNPPLPDWKLKAAHAIGMSNVVKVSDLALFRFFGFCVRT